jgi:Tfp pilus assembly protein PilF
MKKMFKVLASVMMAVVVMTSCSSLGKMQKEAAKISYKVSPEILETHAGNVAVKIEVNFPPKYFNKEVIVDATPVITYEGGEKAFATKTLQGEDIQENNTVIPYESGKTITYEATVSYEEAMRLSQLEMRLSIRKGDKVIACPAVKIADGVISTSTLVQNTPSIALGVDNFQRIIRETKEADLHYLINSSNASRKELRAEDVKAFADFIKKANKNERQELKGIEIKAYASPDGEEDFNQALAERREKSSKKYIKRSMRRIEEFKSEEFFKSLVTAEDWDGFKTLMEESNIQDKELILRVLSMYNDPEVREREIKNISAAFSSIAKDILPKLRRAKFIMSVDNIGFTNEELLTLIKAEPSKLNNDEVLFTATLLEANADKLYAYELAMNQFPADWRGYNDAAMIKFNMGNIDEANALFVKADDLSANNIVVKNNLGAIALYKGEIENAQVLFGAAAGAGQELDCNNGIVSLKKGKYDDAVKYLSKCKCVNSALASLLAKNNSEALKKLNSIQSELAIVDYLKAIVGARTSNEQLVITSLKAALAKDATLKAAAKTDLEFAKYFTNAEFIATVQ